MLHHPVKNLHTPLPPQSTEYNSPTLGLLRRQHRCFPGLLHANMVILLQHKDPKKWIETVGLNPGIGDHKCFEVEPPVRDKHHSTHPLRLLQRRGGAAENLARGERFCLRHHDVAVPLLCKHLARGVHCGDELNGPGYGEARSGVGIREGVTDGGGEASGVDSDLDEDVEHREEGGCDGDEAGVPVVDEDVRIERLGGAVGEAAGAVGGVGEDEDVVGGVGLEVWREEMGEREGEEEQALGELQRDAAGAGGADAVRRLVELEVVVGGEEGGGGGGEGGVGEDGGRDRGVDEALRQVGRLLLLGGALRGCLDRGEGERGGGVAGVHGGGGERLRRV